MKIRKCDSRGKERPVLYWTPIVQRYSIVSNYKDFIDSFVHLMMNMLTGTVQPMISPQIRKVLQLAKNNNIGDWYLYQNHTEIRVYGCHLTPYKLPKYLPLRIVSLEYFRQIVNLDDVHIMDTKKKTQFKVKSELGPFICNNRQAQLMQTTCQRS